MYRNTNIRITADGRIEQMCSDGITYIQTGRNIQSFYNKHELEKEFGHIDKIEDLGDNLRRLNI